MKYQKQPVVIEAITFAEFVEFAKQNSKPPHWSFNYKGHPITHENDECYLIPTLEGTHRFTPKDMLITGVKGEIYPCKIDIFEATYKQVGDRPDFLVPENCQLVACWSGDGWSLSVETPAGNLLCQLAWPSTWPKTITDADLKTFGFEIA